MKTHTVESLQDQLQDVAMRLIIEEPFYGHIISGINRKVVDDSRMKEVSEIRSLGLSTVTIDFSFKLWAPLTRVEKQNRMKHEVLHYIFMHPWADRPKNKGLFYTACDLSVNMYVNDKMSLSLNNFRNLSQRYNIPIDTSDGWFSIYKSLEKMFQVVPASIKDEEKIKEYIESAMKGDWFEKDSDQLKESIFFLPQTGSGNMNISGMSGELSEMMNPSGGGEGATDEEIQDFIQKNLDQGTDPWESVAEGTSDLGAKSTIARALKDAKGRGDVPGGLTSYVDLFLSPPKIDWKREVRNFSSLMGNVVARTTMTRRSKRYKTFPSLKIRRTQRVGIIVDTSGSVSDKEFQDFLSEMRGILQEGCEVIFIQADAVVDKVDIFDSKIPEMGRFTRAGFGGTSFDDGLLYLKTRGRLPEHSHLPKIGAVDGVIYMTDAYAPAPKKENLPMGKLMWLTTQKPVDQMISEGFTGKIVFLDSLED